MADCIVHYHTARSPDDIGKQLGQLLAIVPLATVSSVMLTSPTVRLELRPYKHGSKFGDYIPFPEFFEFNHQLTYDHRVADDLDTQIATITKVLEWFWAAGIPAVAACSYDSYLPHAGGYRSTAVPWPNEIVIV